MEDEQPDYELMLNSFANALSYLLKEKEGIVVNGKDSNDIMQKIIVRKTDKQILIEKTETINLPLGSLIWFHDSAEDAILDAATDPLSQGFIIEDIE
jgi:hypothetical protein